MIKNFKIFENNIEEYKEGDYVILHSGAIGKIIRIYQKIFDMYYDIELYIDESEKPIMVNFLIKDNIKKKMSEKEFNDFIIKKDSNKYNI